jgi:hypothetical protein
VQHGGPRQAETARIFADRPLLWRAGLALALANARYWTSVTPRVRALLRRYQERALSIPDPLLRRLALEKLNDQGFHAQVAATLATLAPLRRRRHAVEAIVALEVMYDYLDALTERPVSDPIAGGHRLFQCFGDALASSVEPIRDYYAQYPRSEDGGYLDSIVLDVRRSLAELPAMENISATTRHCAARFTEAQIRAHAIPSLGVAQLREWSAQDPEGMGLDWLEYFAGATSSIVGLHALVAAGAHARTTREDAIGIDRFYVLLGVLITMLDSLVDYERDTRSTGEEGFARYCEHPGILIDRLPRIAKAAVRQAADMPDGAHHVMTLVGAVAFYTSLPAARSPIALQIVERLERELRPLIWPTLGIMRTWRAAKRLRAPDSPSLQAAPRRGAGQEVDVMERTAQSAPR